MADDELYVGYLPQPPPGVAAWVKRTVAVIFVVAAAVALVAVTAQQPFSPAVYEFGTVRDFEGVVRADPYPTLEVARPGRVEGAFSPPGESASAAASRYYLVNPFKHGAEVAPYEGRRVRARGSLLYRGDQTMIEWLPEEVETAGEAGAAAPGRSYGTHALLGTIVDGKCYLGIMKPGSSKPHRACAARCISGGVPPLFVVRDAAGALAHLLLVGGDGRALNQEVLAFVAEPLEIRGEVVRVDDLWILKAEPETFRRLEQ